MNISSVSGTARQYLRDGSHAEHLRLNQHPLLNGITRPTYDLVSYQRVLLAYFHFYASLETAIDQALAAGLSRFSYDARRKLAWLASDLEYFAIDPESRRPCLPFAPSRFANEAELLGALYTIEGSSLGGLVISRHLAEHHGLTASSGARFFHGYGAQTMPLWGRFEAFMNAGLAHETLRHAALVTAKSTFTMMESMLDEYLVRE